MNIFQLVNELKAASYKDKQQLLQFLLRIAERDLMSLSKEDRQLLLSYAYGEVDAMLRAIPITASYREKDMIFDCEDALLGLIMRLCGTPDQLPIEQLTKIQSLVDLVQKERYIETALDSIFQGSSISEADVNRLLYWAKQTTDEYQKSKLFQGLIYYKDSLKKLSPSAQQLLGEYIVSEASRLKGLPTEDSGSILELIADIGKHFPSESMATTLEDLLLLGRNHINYYAVESLLTIGREVPQTVITALAEDLEYADLTFCALRQMGKTKLFPKEYITDEYLGKSNLVHWLTYPTELGKAPDEILYIGEIKQFFKSEVFRVYRFRSDSETLDGSLRNQWLIGWSSEEGGTFSNFDLYADFEAPTAKETLKRIKKLILG